jgi:beta-galactosidase
VDWLAVGGDFGHAYGMGDDDAFCANGVLSSDRRPHHHAAEVKKVYQPFKFEPYNLAEDEFMITSKNAFTDNTPYNFFYTIFSAERTLLNSTFDFDHDPYGKMVFQIQRLPVIGHPGEEFFVRFSVKLKEDQPFMPAGTEVAYDEFKLDWPSAGKEPLPEVSSVTTQTVSNDKGNTYHFMGEHFDIAFDTETGEIVSYKYDNQELLKGKLKQNFWRAPTLNDEVDRWAVRPWTKAGLQHLKPKCTLWQSDRLNDGAMCLNTTTELRDTKGALQIVVNSLYRIDGNGNVVVTNRVEPMETVVSLPKIGMQFRVPLDYRNLTYFGKDTENYPDRNASGKMGLYKVDAMDLFEQHVVPQDNGNHADTRWLALTSDQSKVGLYITMPEFFNFSAYNYDDDNLTAAHRINQLDPKDFLTVNIDYKQAPLGTATCGPGVDEKYVIKNQVYEYTVMFRAFDTKAESPLELSRYQVPEMSQLMVPAPEIKATMAGKEDFRIYNRPLTISMTCADPEAEIRYTTDGSEPTKKSSVYKSSFVILKTCTIKAKSFKKGEAPSFTTLRQFNRLNIKNTTFVNPPSEPYCKNADIALMDNKMGLPKDYYNDWLGFFGEDMDATIELAVPTDISMVKVGICHEPKDWVVWPKSVLVSFSNDGKEFTDWQLAELPVFDCPNPMQGFGRIEARARVNAKQAKFIRVKVENPGTLPKWHPSAGEKAWIMVDEVMVE